ncbi:MAG: hypothetical protein COT71_00070 [Candidatus Andersenbacteria bacterium CG10_big_fil_rev_8_21_14_0_10_54_11]|uniref:Glycosyltransferase RgtA/B/C/D-like domain-containing protein n=1 Tax=Candidatus Andersenbacteria bacterium CG10_big_fil_rev_8_21_14_0_10_54_11 TaxID=1974485 RepID=A0A2M6X0J5_9BACT|nr:MAG: hypothetical protein COT71_00070 [Candidatus Andersenbacteria bacterium CG10_big_fil_rev_8_21_14_0_10_54_11]
MTLTIIHASLLPLLATLTPGLLLLADPASRRLPPLALFARTLAAGFMLICLLSLAAPYLLLSRSQLLLLATAAGIAAAIRFAPAARRLLPYVGLFTLLYAAFSIPYMTFHQALPTGDVQKSILWAQRLPDDALTPDYQSAVVLLNRDPVDFYTPGLHAIVAAVMGASPDPFAGIGFYAIALSLAAAAIGAAITAALSNPPSAAAALTAAIFILTNLRFLRYLREPGYHFQNIAGELMLWALVLLTQSLIKRHRKADFILFAIAAVVLTLTHQFSAFLAPFVLGAAVLAAAAGVRRRITAHIRKHIPALTAAAAVLVMILGLALTLNLQRKLPVLFTFNPHLLPQTPIPDDYPQLVGWPWLLAGLPGIGLLLRRLPDMRLTAARRAVAASALILLVLSQAPRIFIDIPPVRALFYAIVPLSIAAAISITEGIALLFSPSFHLAPRTLVRRRRRILHIAAAGSIIVLGISLYHTAVGAFTLSHTVRTNSTLLPEYVPLITALQPVNTSNSGAILIDDYNRRSSSWLVLSGRPMYTRIAADLTRQMEEAGQSEQRYRLYLAQLDYEKIFALGSLPIIQPLLEKYNISYITGITNSSDTSLSNNPLFVAANTGADITLYQVKNTDGTKPDLQSQETPSPAAWLLRASTMANDIGDAEDTFEHLPASLRSTRLSSASRKEATTYRTAAAPFIPLIFNVGDYARILWDKEHTGQPDTSVELLVQTLTPMPLTVRTQTGATFTGRSGELLKIPALAVPFDERGFIRLTLVNENQQPISIDLIALGLARTP